jgi:tRNA(adenine34) deaminase
MPAAPSSPPSDPSRGAEGSNVLDDDTAMGLALDLAREAAEAGEVPVGAVVLVDGRVVAARRNEREASGDPTAHAEVLALRDAAAVVGERRLHRATLVVTLEPCPMCAGAVWAAQVGRVVYGAADLKAGAMGSLYNLAVDQRLNHETDVRSGVRADEAAALLTEFFARRR